MAKIFDADILEPKARQNFTNIINILGRIKTFAFLLLNWSEFSKTINATGTITINHTMGVIPTDIIITRQNWASGSVGTVVPDYTSFTKNSFAVIVSGGTISVSEPLSIGGFIGRKD